MEKQIPQMSYTPKTGNESHTPTKNSAFSAAYHTQTIIVRNFKGQFLKITLSEKLLCLIHKWLYLQKKEANELDFGIKFKLKVCSLQ